MTMDDCVIYFINHHIGNVCDELLLYVKRRIHYDDFKPVHDITSRMLNAIQVIHVVPIRSFKVHAELI